MLIDQMREYYSRHPHGVGGFFDGHGALSRDTNPGEEAFRQTMQRLWLSRVLGTEPLVIEAMSVASYFDRVHPTLEVSIDSGVYNAAPPYEQAWIEWEPHDAISWYLHPTLCAALQRPYIPRRVCCFIESMDLAAWHTRGAASSCLDALLPEEMSAESRQSLMDSRWLLACSSVMTLNASDSFLVSGSSTTAYLYVPVIAWVVVSPAGKPDLWGTQYFTPNMDVNRALDLVQLYQMTKIPLLTFSFLHSKNVTLVPQVYESKHQQARLRAQKPPFVRFHTLHVHPGAASTTHRQTPTGADSSLPLHQVRGHFADYRNGAGLFGKYQGLFWIPQHARGQADNGRVQKRYVVHDH